MSLRQQVESIVDRKKLPDILVPSTLMIVCLVLGGSSSGGVVVNAIVQLTCVAAIALAVMVRSDRHRSSHERLILVLAWCFVGIFALQLVPLPAAMWQTLPGHADIARDLAAAGVSGSARPLSLAPAQTVRSLLGLLPLLAFVMLMPRLSRIAAYAATAAMLIIMAGSVVIGLLQVAGGRGAMLYFYTLTNRGDAVGFFANSNHFSTLMYAGIPLAMGLAWSLRLRGKSFRRSPFSLLLLATVPLLGGLGVMASGSLAGAGLFALALIGSALIPLGSFLRRGYMVPMILVTGALVAVGASGILHFGGNGMENGMARNYMWAITWDGARAFFPWGSGFGSFEQAFHLFEYRAVVTPIYANHAHNDLLELLMEGGVPAMVLLIAFLGWLAVRSAFIWFGTVSRDPLGQGASLTILLILLHSLVDYPLRTAAIAAVFGLCCALLAHPSRAAQKAVNVPQTDLGTKHLSA